MFTPPPSPLPPALKFSHGPSSSPSTPSQKLMPLPLSLPPPSLQSERAEHGSRPGTSALVFHDRKHRIAWLTTLTAIVVPFALFFLTCPPRFFSFPLFMGWLDGPSPEIHVADASNWSGHTTHLLHRRGQTSPSIKISAILAPTASVVASEVGSGSAVVFPSSTVSSSSSPSPTSAQTGTQTVPLPTVPTSPPVLPTPFPQPFDTTLSSNFTTNSCELSFTNMTESLPFRQCRPFSFLSQTSSAFLMAQSNITALNIDVWGTCNTPIDADQCAANMAWFTSALQDACSEEKSESNSIVLQALASLQTYSFLRQVGCLTDQNTSVYCYVKAAAGSNPADMYLYSLPFGIPLPNNSAPTCSNCVKSVLSSFGAQENKIDGLKQTFNAAVNITSAHCGADFIHVHSFSSSSATPQIGDKASSGWIFGVALCALLLGL